MASGHRFVASWLKAVALGTVLAGAGPARAQAPDAPRPALIVSASVEVVRLAVVVSEKRGRPRAGC